MGEYEPQHDDDEVISADEAAAMLHVARKTLWNWCSARRRGEQWGQLGPPYVQMGHRLKFRKGDVRRYLHSHTFDNGNGSGDAA